LRWARRGCSTSRWRLGVAVALAQIGEFSFVLANLGADLRMLTSEATNTLIAVAIVPSRPIRCCIG
jgi:predicted Kef-type K+ transport protein